MNYLEKLLSSIMFFLIAFFVLSCNSKDQQFIEKKIIVDTVRILYAVSKFPTPVLNVPDFDSVYGGRDGKTLKKSSSGLIKELEYVAYVGSVFKIIKSINRGSYNIYEVNSKEYDIKELGINLFIDSRFVDTTSVKPVDRILLLPTKDSILKFMDENVGALYVWGANNVNGVKQMTEFYKPKGQLSEIDLKEWSLKGVDCSGLLYEATNGYTPRNTYQLVYFGKSLKIEGLKTDQILSLLKPLDIIVWKGHVIIVYDDKTTIQSAHSSWGVVKKDLKAVIEKTMSTRKPVNEWKEDDTKQFIIKRWYPE